MKLKAVVEKQEFFNKLIKSNCKFKKICNLYPANCKKTKYIGQLKNFHEVEVFEINDNEADFFKLIFNLS